jgi:hypothetical protein
MSFLPSYPVRKPVERRWSTRSDYPCEAVLLKRISMFREFFRFEVSYWLRSWMVYIFLAVIALLFGIAAGSDAISVAGVGGNMLRNSPYSVAMWYAGASLITAFMAAAIYDSSASRDFANKMSFAKAPDRRIAGHNPNARPVQRDQRCICTLPRRRVRAQESGPAHAPVTLSCFLRILPKPA